MSVKIVHVAVAVLINEVGQVLLSKRGDNQHQGGLWEFPGGKVERDESVFDALVREFLEEVGVRILNAQPLLKISHDYGDKHVMLDVWLSRQSSAISDARVFEGEAQGKENQQIIWADFSTLDNYHFPEANKAIITRLKTLS
jgi:8-oxo-dGTP diphosphatase